ncbi:hypothetical protein GVAV_001308 [Gurleya vavrai]
MNRNYQKNILLYKLEKDDYYKIITNKTLFSQYKHVINEIFNKLLPEPDEYKVKNCLNIIKNYFNEDLELQLRLEKKILVDFFFSFKISEFLAQCCFDFYDAVKVFANDFALDFSQKDFLQKNFLNYYVFVKLTKNYDFKVKINEFCLNVKMKNFFNEIFMIISNKNLFNNELDIYLQNFQNKQYTSKIISERKNKIMHLDKKIIHSKNIFNTKNLLCILNSENFICKTCKVEILEKIEVNSQLEIEDFVKKRVLKCIKSKNMEDLKYLIEHTEHAITIDSFKFILKIIFSDQTQNTKYIALIKLFDVAKLPKIEDFVFNIFTAVFVDYNKTLEKVLVSIIYNINLTEKLISVIFQVLIKVFENSQNLYLKLKIQSYIQKNMKVFIRYKKSIIATCFSYIDSKSNDLMEIFKLPSEIFSIEIKTFIVNHMYYILHNLYEMNACESFENEFLSHAIPFYVSLLIKKSEFQEKKTFFGYSAEKIKIKYGCKIVAILLLDGFEFKHANTFFFNDDIKNYFTKNINQILFFVRKTYIDNQFAFIKCIYEVFLDLLNILEDDAQYFYNQIFPYVEFFIEKYEYDLCKEIHEDRQSCRIDCIMKFDLIVKKFKIKNINKNLQSYIDLELKVNNIKESELINKLKSIASLKNKGSAHLAINKIIEIFDFYISEKNKNNKEHLIDSTVLKNNRDFNKFLSLFYNNFSDNEEGINFLGRIGAIKIDNIIKNSKYIFISNFDIQNAAIYILEDCLLSIDNENQDIYFFSIQETLKYIDDKKKLKDSVFIGIKQFCDTKFCYNIDLEQNPKQMLNFKLKFKYFIKNLLLFLLYETKNENLNQIYDFCRLGTLFDTKIIEVYALIIIKLLNKHKKNFKSFFDVEIYNIKEIDSKILDFYLKLNAFINFNFINTKNIIIICLERKEWHYLLRMIEYMNDQETNEILIFTYLMLENTDNCYELFKKCSNISPRNLFYELYLEKDFKSAKKCAAKLLEQKHENNIFIKKIVEEIENKENVDFDIVNLYEKSDKTLDLLSKWNITEDQEMKLSFFHLKYDIEIFKNSDCKIKALKAIELRRKKVADSSLMLNNHLNFCKLIRSLFCNDIQLKKIDTHEDSFEFKLKNFEINIVLDQIKQLRKKKSFIECQDLINEHILKGNFKVIYEKVKSKIKKNDTCEAIYLLQSLEKYIDTNDVLYEKCVVLHAKLSKSSETFEIALEKIKNSEKLFFHKGKFFENKNKFIAFESYLKAFELGKKYCNEIIPKVMFLLTENEINKIDKTSKNPNDFVNKACDFFSKIVSESDLSLFINFFNDIVPKICHPNLQVREVIKKILQVLCLKFPQKSFWLSLIIFNSNQKELQAEIKKIFNDLSLDQRVIFQNILELSLKLNEICEYKIKNEDTIIAYKQF